MSERDLLLKVAGSKLRNFRNDLGESVHKVARNIDISGNYLSEIERGIKEPSSKVLTKIASYYNKDKSYIFSLYNRIGEEEEELIASNPNLRNLISKISMDSRLTSKEKDNLYKEFQRLYDIIKSK